MEFFSENLIEYGKQGYQIVFDEHGIRAWYRFCYNVPKLYEGYDLAAAIDAIEQHMQDDASED